MTSRANCYVFLEGLLYGFVGAFVGQEIYQLIDKLYQHDDQIEELFSRLEECETNHESSQDHELKK